jgi:elongation factor G
MRFEERDIPEGMAAEAHEWREKMVEAAAEANEDLMNKYLEVGDLDVSDIRLGLRLRTIANELESSYTDLEVYLHELSAGRVSGWNAV